MTQSAPPQARSEEPQALLRDLARLHPYAFAYDDSGKITWMTRRLEALNPAARGQIAAEIVPELTGLSGQTCVSHLNHATLRSSTGIRSIAATWIPALTPANATTHPVAILQLTQEEANEQGNRSRSGADFLEAILHNTPDAVIALDRCGFITYTNSAVERLTRFTREELLHSPAFLLAARNHELEEVVSQLASENEAQTDIKCQGADGKTRWLQISSQPLILETGETDGRVVFLRDVTERQQILGQLAEKNAELEHYVNTVSHDLRSPLVSLLGFSHLLRQDYENVLDDTGQHFLDRIEQAARTMESLTDDLLSLSKIGQVPIQKTLLDVGPVLSQLGAELKHRLEARGAKLIFPRSPHFVYSDPTRLYQIFSNLIGNALFHMGDASDAEIHVDLMKRGDSDLICVRDNGVGIPIAEQQRIFRPFQRGRNTKRANTTGMGLAIVQKIASIHGGRAWVVSQPGQGSNFFVSLARR